MDDQMFRKACEQWHWRFSHDLQKGQEDDAQTLEQRVGQYAEEWRDHLFDVRRQAADAQRKLEELRRAEASAYRRYRLLAQLRASMKQRIRRHAVEQRRAALRKLAESLEHGGDDETHA